MIHATGLALLGGLAFVAGALAMRLAPLVGLLTQVFAVLVYQLFQDDMNGLGGWLAVACVAGPVFGLAGTWWRRGAGRRPILGAGILSGVFGMAGMWHLTALHQLGTGIAFCAAALLVPLVLGRTWRERLLGLVVAMLVAPLAVTALSFVAAVTDL